MRRHSLSFRFAASASAIALAIGLSAPAAIAQPAPPPAPAPPVADATTADPPARVGRIATLVGTVSFHGAGAQTWSAATQNYPVSDGDGLWTEPGASTSIEVSATVIALSASTEFEVATLDATSLVATEAQGESYLQLTALQPGETYTIRTPRGTVTLAAAGKYEIAAGDTEHPTVITVVEGIADLSGPGVTLHITAGQAAAVNGADTFQGVVGPLTRDAFLVTALGRYAPAPQVAGAVAPPAVVAAMTGSADLDRAGSWRTSPEYGTVWYPRVEAGWRPYRDGNWSNVGPWGWTWVDAQPWGFAPSHYGRWIEVDRAWAWAPAPYAVGVPIGIGYRVPVYAPALVAFFGVGVGVGAAIGFGGFHNIGWVPLGPGEAFHPWYGHSDGYLRSVNIRNVTNVTNISNVTNNFGGRGGITEFRNHGAATVVSASAVIGAQRIGPRAQLLGAAQYGAVRQVSASERPAAGLGAPHPAMPGPAIGAERGAAVPLRGPGTPHGAPGPAFSDRAGSGAPALRAAEPGVRTGPVEPNRPAAGRQEANRAEPRPAEPRPAEPRSAEPRPGETRPAEPHLGEARPAPGARPGGTPPAEARRGEPPHIAQSRPAQPRVAAARPPAPHVAAPRPAAPHVAARPAPRPPQHVAAAPRPAPHGGPPHRG